MSFILQVFHAPRACTIDDASQAIDTLGAASREDRLRLVRFLTALNERFPSHLDMRTVPGPKAWRRIISTTPRFTFATDWSRAMAWVARWVAWVEDEGLGHLANLERPAGLARYLLDDGELQMMARRTDLPAGEILHRIVLAGVYGGAERLIAWLDTPQFAREAERVRALD